MKTSNITGIIINKIPRNEYDEVLVILTKEAIIYILAKGVKKIESKNRIHIFLGAICNFEIFENYSHANSFLLKKATLSLSLPNINKNNAPKIKKIIYIFSKIKNFQSDLYDLCNQLLLNFEKDNFYKHLTFLLSRVIASSGEGLSYSFCTFCFSNQNLIFFDASQGGIICNQHTKNKTKLDLLKSFYFLGTSYEKYLDFTNASNNKKIFDYLILLLY